MSLAARARRLVRGRAGPPASPFYPGTLGDLYLGYEGTDEYVDGTWADKSGNGRHATQATAGNRPTAGTLGVKAALVYGGVSHYLNLPNLSAMTAAEIYIQLATDSDAVVDTAKTGLWFLGTSGQTTHYRWSDANIYDDAGSTTRRTLPTPAPVLSTRHIYSVTSVAGEWTARIDDASQFTTATNTVGLPAAPLLGRTEAGAYHLAGKVCAFLVYSSPLTAPNRTLLHAYLNS